MSNKVEGMPDKVNILGITYAVEYVESPIDVDHIKRTSLWGQIDFWTRTIRVYCGSRSEEDMWHTLFHEILHGITEGLHLKSLKEESAHEELDLYALALVDVMSRNGWLTTPKT